MKRQSILTLISAILLLQLNSDFAYASEKQRPLHIKILHGKDQSISPRLRQSKYSIFVKPIKTDTSQINSNIFINPLKLSQTNRDVLDAIRKASKKTNVSFELLAVSALLESSLGVNIIAQDSSARGPFQFINSTWLSLIKRHGSKLGYQEYAKAIKWDKNNRPYLEKQDTKLEHEILELRYDPYTAALIKAYQIKEETPAIKKMKKNGSVTITDQYLVHVMGLELAKNFYATTNINFFKPLNISDNIYLQTAANLNNSLFFDSAGNAMNAPQAYTNIDNKVKKARSQIKTLTVKDY